WQKNRSSLSLRGRVRAGEIPACDITKNASSSSGIQPVRSSTDLSRRSYRCRTTGLRCFRPRRQPPIGFRNHYGFAPNNQPAQPKSLPAYIPFQMAQAFVRKINERRTKAEWAVTRLSVILGIFPALAFLLSHIGAMAGPAVPYVLVGGWGLGAFLSYILGLFVLNRICPWTKLVITAEFDGILPKEAREKARAAKDHFDKLYLIIDQ